jgi:hypothetical protein
MRLSKRRIKRIVLEEQYKLLREQWGSGDAPSPLIEFAQAWAGLGGAVQEQVSELLAAWIQTGGNGDDWIDVVYEQNPNAIDMAWDRLVRPLKSMESYGDSTDLLDALEEAVAIFRQGDEEVEADRAAAEAGGDPTENRRGPDHWTDDGGVYRGG